MDADRNRLLRSFGDDVLAQLDPLAVELETRQVLQEPGMPVLHVYFPLDAVISLVATLENGATVEVGLIGHEGMIGLAGVLGTVEGGTSAVVLVAGTALRVSTKSLRSIRLTNPAVRTALDLYIEGRLVQAAHAVACSRIHPVQARLARWLLGVHDRIVRHDLLVPQEFIADLLGVHRPTVTLALQRLQEEGAITRRGRAIVVVDRSRLERVACECRRVLDGEFDRPLSGRGNGVEALAAAPASRSAGEDSPTAAALEGMREIAGRLLLVSIREQEAREQAEEANRAKDHVLAMISHELRNPLSAILGWCAALQKQDGAPSARGLEVIAQNAAAQLKLIEDLLDSARMTSATLTVHPRTTVVAAIVREVVDTIRPSADQRQVDVRLTIADGVPPIAVDADRLRQLLLNILGNAIKFTGPGGSVAIRVCSANTRVTISIEDTGRGIAPDVLPHVFERFHQGPPADTGGLGLGLSIARAIVELHGGTIGVESPGPNRGTTCTIDLPIEARRRERRAG